MKRLVHTLTLLIACTWFITSCTNLFEDLPECRLFVKFKYDYNMHSVDAFHKQVDKVELYVFDKDGKFLFKQTEEGSPLATGNYLMEVEAPIGEYKFMAWAGAHDSYDIVSLTPGTSTIEELKLKLKRPQSLIINKELEPLWYGEIIDVNFTGTKHQTEIINLIKDTNKVRFIFQGRTTDWQMNVDDYTYEIIESNGYLDYDNSLLSDDALSYQPYYKEQVEPSAGLVELNTMRLMANRQAYFKVTEKATGKIVFDVNLANFLIMLRLEEYKNWSNQEYLDREDSYRVVLFFSEEGSTTDSWLAVQIQINGWTHYLQTSEV
ncbi:FimB/Mfa2 family fimbrial subunit [Bacteroides sp. 519]|uniref:FimB/Mfa2 family fimbrial subunit n=1 Tax=Bacteroides sp. 519 TaxID=2302937 RepID=UPI0013D7EA51|nr:FimB/Mfa2 family fimbrial subunit [Bacteroides sp. 519]NDV59195.1 hypothetical protein [Bacteroides sp. 519]